MINGSRFRAPLRRELAALAASFQTNELAFLALTGKAELAVRDRLAWALYTALSVAPADLLVAREWRRSDLVVLKSEVHSPALMILEAKSRR